MALEKTKSLLQERILFCNRWLENNKTPRNFTARYVDTAKNIDELRVSPRYYEGLNEFKNAKRDFNKGISAIVLLNSSRGLAAKKREELIDFLKTIIGGHINKMIELFREQMKTLEGMELNIKKREKELRELNDCGVEILMLPDKTTANSH